MEEQRQQLQFLFSKFAGSVIEKTDNDLNIRCFTEKQIQSITDNYNTVLGKGGFSLVYKGILDDGRPVAVKRYIFTSAKKEFTREVIIQSQFSHRNIVRLLGCCVEADAPMLVTEFVPNGNLSDLLHGLNTHRVRLSLDTRLQIASDVAEALVYMHTSQSHAILHGDIKPENIFIDNNYMPKLSDFGISRLLSMSSDEYTGYVIGSMGYVDPVFCQTGRLTTKSDVYSFGVVLLELVTRKKAIDDNKNFLAKTFDRVNKRFSRQEILDGEIATAENMAILDGIVNLALDCVKFELEERPEMRDVSECLRKLQRNHWKHLREMVSSLQQSGFERFITKKRINKMTDNFRSMPTECFMGKIYRGKSGKMPCVAIIKMSFEVHSGVSKVFSHQMILHSKVNHENVVKFEGCSLDGDVPILVYEYSQASLHDILFGHGKNHWTINSEERLLIAISIAEGLDYLHSLGIVHGDFRTANVLVLNDISQKGFLRNVRIKVSGIGASVYLSVAKAAHERIKAEENNGYIDPRFLESGALTKEADVYSFGVVLLELFTGKMVSNLIRNCRIEELWDNKAVCHHIEETRRIIFRCLEPDISRRPKLKEAIKWFAGEWSGISVDRLDGHFCNDNCAARFSK